MTPSKIVLIIYGIFLFAGAIFGLKAGSKISLIMGLISAMLVFAGIFIASSNLQSGANLLVFVSGFLTLLFFIRFLKTHQFMPSGMLLAASLLAFIVSLCILLQKCRF